MSDWLPPYLRPTGETREDERERRRREAARERGRRDYERLTLLLLLGVITLSIGAIIAVLVGIQVAPPPFLYQFALVAMAFGFLATWGLGVFLSAAARQYLWLVLMIFPPTAVPAAVAYAVIRRAEVRTEL